MNTARADAPLRTIGRYALFDEIAAGGMATVHLGRLLGPVGFSRTVAIKRLHAHFAKDPDFSAGFVDEARLAARIHHPNVVPIIDVLHEAGELSLVMDYIEGDSLARLLRTSVERKEHVPLAIASAVVCGALYGLHAAHEAIDESGEPMHIVHRDISPQNILVGSDGVPRIVDFGVAKAAQRLQTTADGQVKGKIAYMAPEQIRQAEVSRQTDIYAMGVVLWEAITRKRLFVSENHANLMAKVLDGAQRRPSELRQDCPTQLDDIVMRALHPDPSERYSTARELAAELQKTLPPAPPTEVGDWVSNLADDALRDRRRVVKRVESRELPADHDGEDFGSRPSTEDILTVVQGTRALEPVGDSKLNSGEGRRHQDGNRIFVPLVVGLAAVVAVIAVLLLRNEPRLETTTPESKATLPPPDGSRPSPDDAEASQSDQRAQQAPDGVTETESAEPTSQDDSAETVEPESRVQEPEVPTSQPVAPAQPAPCPKFVVDDEGIRRVNRECWK